MGLKGVGDITEHVIELDEKCKSCKGTGLYIGMSERDGIAVVCNTCKGTGCYHYCYKYEDFDKREVRQGIKHVIEANPGISVGIGKGRFKYSDFGGMPYENWRAGESFTSGTEMRKFTCPAWWYQTIDYIKKPNWEECMKVLYSTFISCSNFPTKDKCWDKWDTTKTERNE